MRYIRKYRRPSTANKLNNLTTAVEKPTPVSSEPRFSGTARRRNMVDALFHHFQHWYPHLINKASEASEAEKQEPDAR